MIEGKIVYFEKPGAANTDEVLRLSRARADELGINTILVASTEGTTALKAAEVFRGKKVVAVTHHVGFREPNVFEWTSANIEAFEQVGGIRLTTSHAFFGLSRAVKQKWNTYAFEEMVTNTLRIFGEGMKVVCEIAMMAADAGLARTDEDVICIAGSGRGADTAIVLRPVNLRDFFDLRIKEVLCKPHF
jgi:uncharacterized protein